MYLFKSIITSNCFVRTFHPSADQLVEIRAKDHNLF